MSSLTITIIQANLVWENKQANLELLEQKIESISSKTELVILPEMFSTGFSMKPSLYAETMDGSTIQWMKKMATTKGIILTGSVIIEENGSYFNRLIWMLPTGELGYYDKRHLFAFAGEDKHYAAGNRRLIASVKGWRINLQICYDLRFPVWARQTISMDNQQERTPEYDLLIYVANWPEKRNHAWKTLLSARAIENQCYVVGVNRIGVDGNEIYHSGDSQLISPLGEVLFQQAHEEVVQTITLEKETLMETRNKFPFWKDADEFKIY
jgi:predicted amidohydrolase